MDKGSLVCPASLRSTVSDAVFYDNYAYLIIICNEIAIKIQKRKKV